MPRDPQAKLRVAAVGDLHCRDEQAGRFRKLVQHVNATADVLLLCGDLTDHGTQSEGKTLADELAGLRVPCAAVMGNHDFEHNTVDQVWAELARVGVRMLDGDHVIFDKVLGVAGVKGFGGGFGSATLQAFGEAPTKSFVQESVSESLKLEAALSQLDTPKKIVILHYSPVVETLEGENVEIRAFLGTSRLTSPIDQFRADVVFHGHAHHGSLEGKTPGGIPVYNVSMPLLTKVTPDQRFRLIEV